MLSRFFAVPTLFLAACGEPATTAAPVEVWEGRQPGECTDGADNDGDRLFDCEDSDCGGAPDCEPSDSHDTADEDSGDTGPALDSGDDSGATGDADGDGYDSDRGDCDDTNPLFNPGATDVAGDGLDLDCDGVDGVDGDGDGYASTASGGDDCDDANIAVNIAGTESSCDGFDDDCDGLVDDGALCDVGVQHLKEGCDSDGHAYLFVGYGLGARSSWDDARTWCQARGYDLMVVDDECEWDWLEEQAHDADDGQVASVEWWIGYHCDSGACTQTSDFTWVDGSAGYIGSGGGYGDACAGLRYAGDPAQGGVGLIMRPWSCEEMTQMICESLR